MAGDYPVLLQHGVRKAVTVVGHGDFISDGMAVEVLYCGRLVDGTTFDTTSWRGNKPMKILVGSPAILQGWNIALRSMLPGERCSVYMPCKAAYGNSSDRDSVPPGSDLFFDVEVTAVYPAVLLRDPHNHVPEVSQNSLLTFIDEASTLKEQGNERLTAGDTKAAVFKYLHALQFVTMIRQRNMENTLEKLTSTSLARLEKLCVTIHCNMSQAYLKDKYFAKALEEANEALQAEPLLEKALFRKAMALEGLYLPVQCSRVLTQLLTVNPANSAALKWLQRLKASGDVGDSAISPVPNAPSEDKLWDYSTAICSSRMDVEKPAARLSTQPATNNASWWNTNWWLYMPIMRAAPFLQVRCPCLRAAIYRLRRWWSSKLD